MARKQTWEQRAVKRLVATGLSEERAHAFVAFILRTNREVAALGAAEEA